ncbi:flagellar basal body rod protein FlgB [Bordetella genomosp. 13]|uniref:flagellar basal body rod protein FlgB n=1 Tax=Bordetella genomosp. 13 TaxID=463040 RepID=UPI0011A8C525|nr:flagellar basal body rod protein FlgB [Bordetella genomosp. 13]
MLDRLSDDFRFFQQSISLRAQRQEVLSSNIANADTPNYKARDFDFKTAMENAMGERMRLPDTQLALTSPRHIPAQALTPPSVEMQYRLPYQASLDGNTVDMDNERVRFADNTLHYQSSLQILSGRIRSMMMAIQE